MNQNNKLTKLQEASKEILYKIDDICKEYNLSYYLAYGTLLGAVRHGDFIPWDDDIDIIMFRDDYTVLLNNFDKWFPKKYYLNHYSSEQFNSGSYAFRICNPDVRFRQLSGTQDKILDSFVTIFPVDGAPRTRLFRKIHEIRIDILYTMLRLARSSNDGVCKIKRSIFEKIGIWLNYNIIRKKGDTSKAARKLDLALMKYKCDESRYVSTYGFGITPFYYEKNLLESKKRLQFGEKKLICPTNYDLILKIWYGDYKRLPPVEKRIPQHSDMIL